MTRKLCKKRNNWFTSKKPQELGIIKAPPHLRPNKKVAVKSVEIVKEVTPIVEKTDNRKNNNAKYYQNRIKKQKVVNSAPEVKKSQKTQVLNKVDDKVVEKDTKDSEKNDKQK